MRRLVLVLIGKPAGVVAWLEQLAAEERRAN